MVWKTLDFRPWLKFFGWNCVAERLSAMEPPLKRCKTKTGVNEKLHPTDVRRNLVCWWVLPSPYYTEYNEGSDVTEGLIPVLGKKKLVS